MWMYINISLLKPKEKAKSHKPTVITKSNQKKSKPRKKKTQVIKHRLTVYKLIIWWDFYQAFASQI